jgi:predicted nuclease of predicted toxin-antitoxin system
MKFLIDMNLSPLWIPFLNQKGFEAIHWSDVGPPTALDSEIMEHASSRKYVIFAHDLDCGRLLAMRSSAGPSVVQIRTQDVLPSAVGDVVVNALKAAHAHLDAGALVTIDPAQHRIRLLPISTGPVAPD